MTDPEQTTLPARGGSMFPLVPAGATLEIKPARPAIIRLGDIVCYPNAAGEMVAHRIVGLQRKDMGAIEYRVRGDAQAQEEVVPASAVAYVVTGVNYRGLRYDPRGRVGRRLALLAVERGPALLAAGTLARGALGALQRLRGR